MFLRHMDGYIQNAYGFLMFFDTFEALLEHHSDFIAISFGLPQEA